MDVCIWSPTRSAPHAGDIDDVLRWTTGLFFAQNSNQMLDPYFAEPLHTHGVQPSYNKAKLSRLIASRMTYSTWSNEATNVIQLKEYIKQSVQLFDTGVKHSL